MVYFFDGNRPGVLYCGTEADVDLCRQHGGSPERWTRSTPAVGSTITVLVDRENVSGLGREPLREEQWPVERPNFAPPWW